MSALAFVLSWVAHSTALALVALLMPRLFGVRHPGLLVFWWQGGAAGVVLLPLIPLLLPLRPTGSATAVATFVESGATVLAPAFHAAPAVSQAALLALLWLIGVAVRLGWLVAGQRHLTRLAAAGTPVEHDPALAQARATTGVQVPVIAAASAGPCAFGFSQVRVLVPEALRERPDDQRLAVYLHELVHVVRCDVQRAYGDETWRVIWWWQPSVWWLLARLQLAREYEVDQAVIRQAVPRRAYVDALLWCSGLRPVWSLSPQVGGSHHALVRRVTMFCEEVEMSRMRRWITASAMVLTSATAAAVVGVVTPLQATRLGQTGDATEAGPLERVAVRPTLDAPAPRRTFTVDPVWPASATRVYRFQVHLVLDASGHVAESRVAHSLVGDVAAGDDAATLARARAAVLDAVRQWQFESPVKSPLLLGVVVGVGDLATAPPTSALGPTPLRVGGPIGPPQKIHNVAPLYPAEALAAKVAGVVVIETTIGADGTVADARVLRSVPMLDQAALDAVRQWRYTPTWLNGEPVPVLMTCTVSFTLQ